MVLFLALGLGAAGVLAGVGCSSYGRFVERQLAGTIRAAEFQPHADWEPVRVTDAGMIAEIREWIRGAEDANWSLASYPPPICRLTFVMEDERRVDVSISATGPSSRQFLPPTGGHGPDALLQGRMPYAMIRWERYYRKGNKQLFTKILRHLRRSDASSSASGAVSAP